MSSCWVHSAAFQFKQQSRLVCSKSMPAAASQISNSGNSWEKEEVRWLREEQRWMREEQRWLREEKRWNAEKLAWAVESARMQEEIQLLKHEIERLQGEKSDGTLLRDLLVALKSLLSSKMGPNVASSSAPPPEEIPPKVVSSSVDQVEDPLPSPLLSTSPLPSTLPSPSGKDNGSTMFTIKRTLRNGTEGEDVKLLQEALAKLGFYSGEEEMEDAYFADGTERAVKTWQCSIGLPEDGVVTAQVFANLTNQGSIAASKEQDHEQGALSVAASSTIIVMDPEPTTVQARVSSLDNRVFLLGENRWEDSSRLVQKKGTNFNCAACAGHGTSLCLECDGTGELIVEEQFVDWAGDDPKCPYCEGKGIAVCSDCDGKGTV